MPKISIIIPVYNVEKYLHQSLDSVVNQTLKDIEIICVDDCSTDGSYDILQEYASKDDRFVVLKQETNQGPGVARNRGLDTAKGEYIMFLDPDDWYELDACELCYNQITKNNNDLVLFGHNQYIQNSGKIKYIDKMISPFSKYKHLPVIKLDDVSENFIITSYTVMYIYKKDFLIKNNIRYPGFKNFEDHVFYTKVIMCADSISIIDKPLYYYRINKKSSTYTMNNQHNDIYYVKKSILEDIQNHKISLNKKIAIYVYTIKSSLYWLKHYPRMFKGIEKDFYESVRKIFLMMDADFIKKYVRDKIDYKAYSKYRKILKYNCLQYKFVNFIQKIFSMENNGDYKIITIFGIKIIKNRTITPFHLGILSFLFSWLFPTKEDRKIFRDLCDEIDERKAVIKAQKNYKKIIKRIQNKKDKIKVLFLVSENSKWKAQSLYDLMAQSEKFEPVIALSELEIVHRGNDSTRDELNKNYKFFKNKGMNVVKIYDNHKFIDLKILKPDVVFYEQPWGLDKKFMPKKVAKYALLCYIPYYVNSYTVHEIDYDKPFHKYMFRHYVLNKQWENEYKKLAKRDNIYGLGNTILDNFYLNNDNKSTNNYVIYAPHYSFTHDLNKNPVNYGTFLENGYEILEYAKSHPELNWVFKPHPTLKFALSKIGESEEKINDYWNEWRKIGIVCEDSSYIDLFLDSKALITDSASFLTEYFCTGKPLIHLISDDCKVVPNIIARKNFKTFYQVHNLDEMYETFDKVLIQNIDDKKEERLRVLEETGLLNNYAAKNILQDLESVLIK